MSSVTNVAFFSIAIGLILIIVNGTYFPPEENKWQLINKEKHRVELYEKWRETIGWFCDSKKHYSELIIEGNLKNKCHHL